MPQIPEKPTLDGLDVRWPEAWEAAGTFRFDRSHTRDEIFSVDTPPPTVSGSLHMGSAFGYVQTDAIVRFQRMRGRRVFYPMGWDDNGLATERRVQNYYGVRCEPHLPYEPEFEPPATPPDPAIPISRPNFLELCARLVAQDEQAFEALWRRLGLSVDWTLTYTTVGTPARRTSQRAFLRNLARGEAYRADAPTLWDVDYRTAVAQAELEDRERPGAYHALRFRKLNGGGDLMIDTTRPELLAACVAVVAHPDDERYRPLFGTEVATPALRRARSRGRAPTRRSREGNGRRDDLHVRRYHRRRVVARAAASDARDHRRRRPDPRRRARGLVEAGARAYAEIAGKNVKQAQKIVVEQLQAAGELDGEPRPITHPVKFYERGDRPLEIVTSRQWYYRNGGRDPELREELLRLGRELRWHPPHMRASLRDVDRRPQLRLARSAASATSACRSRSGIRVDADGEAEHDDPILADEDDLPVDPSSDVPPGLHRGSARASRAASSPTPT